MTQQATFVSNILPRAQRQGGMNQAEYMSVAAARMDTILKAHRISVRVTLDASSIVIGDIQTRGQTDTEFVFRSRESFTRLFDRMRLFDFAIAYIDGSMQVRGPISRAVDVFDAMNAQTDQRQTVAEYLASLLFRFSKAALPVNATSFESLDHYSQSAQAYELFLDEYMQYTCGRFSTGAEDIDSAQVAKFQLIERLFVTHAGPLEGKNHLDIGCGWGGMIGYFENHFGTNSVGNTNCAPQMRYAQKRFGNKIIYGDFSRLKNLEERFDLITVVGMMEHLTPRRRNSLLKTIRERLADDGILYLQCIAKPEIWIGGDAYRLAQHEVFKGHHLEYRGQTERRLMDNGFSILESFEHARDYGLTTARWVEKIDHNRDRLMEILGARQYRLFLAYLAFGSKLFSTGRGSLMRYVLKKSTPSAAST